MGTTTATERCLKEKGKYKFVTQDCSSYNSFVSTFSVLMPGVPRQQLSVLYTNMTNVCKAPKTHATHEAEVDRLLSHLNLDNLSSSKCVVLDPCCGTNTIGRKLQERGIRTLTMDVSPEHKADVTANFLSPYTYARNSLVNRRKLLACGAIFSPPFQLTYAFVAMCLARTKHWVIFHLPCTDNLFGRSHAIVRWLKGPHGGTRRVYLLGMSDIACTRGRMGKSMWVIIVKQARHVPLYLTNVDKLTRFT